MLSNRNSSAPVSFDLLSTVNGLVVFLGLRRRKQPQTLDLAANRRRDSLSLPPPRSLPQTVAPPSRRSTTTAATTASLSPSRVVDGTAYRAHRAATDLPRILLARISPRTPACTSGSNRR
ncbi:hypothetical protein PLICRDRAFT_693012 [Plicaturopsis crispa FD-325 SS-3]|nr:hypothetical protein PLICRDRAFT_693012 [Plicaturopsis crispa FD-325 SS-3]